MTKRLRQKLYLIFIVLFFLLTPIMIFYASGYRFDFKKQEIRETGSLILKTFPARAIIKIQSLSQNKSLPENIKNITTPAKIDNLIPGQYVVNFKKENYWDKNLNVILNPNKAVYLQDIYLVKKNIPKLIASGTISDLQISPQRENLIYQEKINDLNKLVILNLAENKIASSTLDNDLNMIKWPEEEKRVLINQKILNLDSGEEQDLKTIVQANGSNFKWSSNGENIYAQASSSLVLYNLNKNKIEPILIDFKINDFLINNNQIFFISEKQIFQSFDLNSQIIKTLSNFEDCENCKIKDFRNNLVIIENKTKNFIYLFDLEKGETKIIKNVLNWQWLNKESKIIIYHNKFEIWKLDTETAESEILIRLDNPIKTVLKAFQNYLAYQTENGLYLSELDTDGLGDSINLLSSPDIINLVINKDKNSFYFLKTATSTQSEIYQLDI